MSKRLLILACAGALLRRRPAARSPKGRSTPAAGVRFVAVRGGHPRRRRARATGGGRHRRDPVHQYLALPGELPEGRHPHHPADRLARTSPAIGGSTSLVADGIWTRGAAAQVKDTPPGIIVPYGPATVRLAQGLTRDEHERHRHRRRRQRHAARGVDRAERRLLRERAPTAFRPSSVYDYGYSLKQAGPIGRPSVAVDADGNPWVAYTIELRGPGGPGRDLDGAHVDHRRRCSRSRSAPAARSRARRRSPSPQTVPWSPSSTPRRARSTWRSSSGGVVDGGHRGRRRHRARAST